MPSLTAHETAIADIIARLLSHYATADEPLAVRRAMSQDWLEDLTEFTVHQVEWAAKEWRRMQTIRPMIADLRKLATQAQRSELDRKAIADQRNQGLDEDTLKMWAGAEYHGDIRSPQQRRQAAIDAQDEKYARGAAYRAGKLDEYDAQHHPEKLRQRQTAAAKAQVANAPPGSPIGQVLREMGVVAEPSAMPLEPGERPMSEAEKERVRRDSLASTREPSSHARGEAAE